ncbi:WGR domain-containing protein [Motiliproteus sediminis]|uniref:WGR domain-containing protein n=1 Tax=Motiliproteus sediminis TaxID=1468178 RepID=UPI001AEFAF1B|nr:WGR domain-containing protein [Motiliproteus sediminis]
MLYRWRKNQQYFVAHLSQDLFGDWILTRSWGDSEKERSQCRHEVMPSHADALKRLAELRRRQQRKGFIEVNPLCG